jgi:hypothetical protein
MLSEKRADIDAIIDFYEGELEQFQQIHFYKEGQKNSSTNNLFLTISALSALLVIIISILVPVFVNQIIVANSNINEGLNNLILLAQNNSTLNKLLLNSTMSYVDSSSQNLINVLDSGKYLFILGLLIILVYLIMFILNSKTVKCYNKELNENAETLGILSKIRVSLYLIKAKYQEELNNKEVNEKILLFYLPFEQYEKILESLINDFEHVKKQKPL